jgi:IS30 family transposase
MPSGFPFDDDVRFRFVELVCKGMSVPAASVSLGVSRTSGSHWWREAFTMRQLKPQDRVAFGLTDPGDGDREGGRGRLSLAEREEIMCGRRLGHSYKKIGDAIGRDKSVVWREVNRNSSSDGRYHAHLAHAQAHVNAARPKPFKLIGKPRLAARVAGWMDDGWSPRLISQILDTDYRDDAAMQISHETIYQCLYVQTRGELRKDLYKQLSLGRQRRVEHKDRSAERRGKFNDAFKISDRPAEADDRSVPGHWEGDLVLGTACKSAVGTLVERTTRFTLLLHLPNDHGIEAVTNAMIAAMRDLPAHLRRSITWDRGAEIGGYERIRMELGAPVYLCDPRSPWQRGTNENTNRLLRHWLTKGTDLSRFDAADIRRIQDTLNRRPRPTLDLQTPAQRMNELLLQSAA